MTHDTPHRSRTAWPGPLSIAGVGEGHTHDLPPALLKRIRRQGRAVLIIGACVVALGVLFLLIILQRGEQRDRENARLEEQIRQGQCDLLDQLPEGGLLDRPREKYGCGPGIPLDDLPPDEAARVREQRAAPVPAPTPAPAPTQEQPPDTTDRSQERLPMPGGAERPVEPTPPPEPSPEPSEPPLIDLGPVGDLLCDNRLVCA